jgi:hypothetical protein
MIKLDPADVRSLVIRDFYFVDPVSFYPQRNFRAQRETVALSNKLKMVYTFDVVVIGAGKSYAPVTSCCYPDQN